MLEQESLPLAGFLANCSPPHLHTTTTTTTATQCKLQYVHAVYAQVVLGKRPPAQVAEGNHHKCRLSVCVSCWNEKHHQRKLLKVRGQGTSIHRRKLEQDAATTCNLHMGTYMNRSCAHVQVVLRLTRVQLALICFCMVDL